MRNKLVSSIGANYFINPFPFIGHTSNTLNYTESVKFVHFKLFWSVLQQLWIGFMRNKLVSSTGANYLINHFPFIGHISNTLNYTENIKLVHFKLFESVYSKADLINPFLFIEHVSNTRNYTESVKFVHFKLFGSVCSNAESDSCERSLFRLLEQNISLIRFPRFPLSDIFQIH